MYLNRLKQLQSAIKNPILIKKKENLFYLTGRSFDYRAEEYLLVTKHQVAGFGSGLERINWVQKSDRLKNIGKCLGKAKRLDIEMGFTYGEGEYLKFKISNSKFKIKPARSPVDEMRQIKDAGELSNIHKSMAIVGKVFARVKQGLQTRPWTERGLAEFITKEGYRFGAQDIAFPAIVASGPNAAIPHHVPSSRRLRLGETIIIDFGFKYKNYCSDFTRTVFLKRVPSRLEKAYNVVERAYLESIKYINNRREDAPLKLRGSSSQVRAGNVYQRAVDVLAEAKLDKYFIHSLGHGAGLEIHELPNLSPGSKDFLQDGMVFSIEPGVYFPKFGGIRIEDLVYLPLSESRSGSTAWSLENGNVRKFININTNLKFNTL